MHTINMFINSVMSSQTLYYLNGCNRMRVLDYYTIIHNVVKSLLRTVKVTCYPINFQPNIFLNVSNHVFKLQQ